MKKRYIIEDARKHLAEQINSIEGIERTAMQENLVKNTKGLSAVIPKDNDGYCTVYKSIRFIRAYSLFTMILKQQAVNGKVRLGRIYWKSTIAEKGVREANC